MIRGFPNGVSSIKFRIRSGNGRIIGIIGFSQSYEGRAKLLPAFQGISKVVSHIRVRYAENLSLRELGRLAGASERQLERKFKTYFGIGPQQYIIRTRLMAACRRLIVTDENLAEIAFTCGFSKPSAFAFYFRRELGLTPSEFRRRQVSGAAQASFSAGRRGGPNHSASTAPGSACSICPPARLPELVGFWAVFVGRRGEASASAGKSYAMKSSNVSKSHAAHRVSFNAMRHGVARSRRLCQQRAGLEPGSDYRLNETNPPRRRHRHPWFRGRAGQRLLL